MILGMLGLLFAGLLLSSSSLAIEVQLDGDSNIYGFALQALEELKARQAAEEDGLYFSDEKKPTSVCYDELGCFDKNGTFKHLKQLPEPPETVNTKFLLYTRKNLDTPQFLDYKKPDTIINSNINPKVPIKFITHGFGGKNNITWLWVMKSAFLEKEDLNIVHVDWTLGARKPYYLQATVNTELIAAETAYLYFLIKDHFGIEEKDLHVIGFSLGAHVAGFVGKKMLEWRGTKPGRITGLDPASLFFEEFGGDVHLYKDDADFVDIIHTNADNMYYGGVGIWKPVGHVDYYPNGGKRQPGCSSTLVGALKDIFKDERGRVCNHEFSIHLFTDSILNDSPCEFTSYQCSSYSDFELAKCMSCEKSCGRMGYKSHGSGTYYLMTKGNRPFCARLKKLKVKFASTVKKSYGSIILTFVGKSGIKENVTVTEKDDKLSPGAEKVQAVAASEAISEIDNVQILYEKYKGWLSLTSGEETFGISSVTIEDTESNVVYSSCNDPPVILKDNVYHTLNQTEAEC